MEFSFAYFPIGVPTFHLESAQKEFENSIKLLRGIDENVVVPTEMLLSIDKLHAFMDTVSPDFVIVQNDYERELLLAHVVQSLVSHAARQRAVTDKRNDGALDAA